MTRNTTRKTKKLATMRAIRTEKAGFEPLIKTWKTAWLWDFLLRDVKIDYILSVLFYYVCRLRS